MSNAPRTLTREGGATIAYHHSAGRTPGVMFCTGFKSDMTGGKAVALEAWCRAAGQAYTRFDYQGHGRSSGTFEEGTIGVWLADALAVLDGATEGPQVVVGSSMGGWMASLLATARPERVAGLVCIASAVDFTEVLMWNRFPDEIRHQIEAEGVWYRPSEYDPEPYPITRRLIEEGRDHLLLPGPIAFDGPVRLLHGMLDDGVPWQHSLKIAEAMRSDDVEIILIKDGDHRLSRDADIERLCMVAGEVIQGLA